MKINKKFLLSMTIVGLMLSFLWFLSNNVEATENQFYYLSDIKYITNQSSVGWGSITLDRNLESRYNNGLITLLIDGKKTQFIKGISAHATSTLVYDLTDYNNYDYFTTYYGVDESRGNYGNGVKFSIYTSNDGENWELRTLASPPVKKGNTNAEFIKIDIRGVKYLKLYADGNGNIDSDHAVYADAKLIKEGYEETEKEPIDFIKTVEEYDEILKGYYAKDGINLSEAYELVLLQRQFVKNVGYDILQLYGTSNTDNQDMLDWLFNDLENLRLYIMGGAPEGGSYYNSINVLQKLYSNYKDDFNITEISKYGTVKGNLYKKMAIALSLTHSQNVGLWMQPSNISDAVTRYAIYKKMYNEGNFIVNDSIDISKWFESYNIEEMRFIMNNAVDDEEILWLNEYTQANINSHPNQVWNYLTPHPYMEYVWPDYDNQVFHDPNRKNYWDEKFGGIFSKYGVTYTTPGNKVYKVWMNFRNEFGTGAVCGGISKTGSNIRASHAIPSAVIGQPGHAAIIYYSQDNNGKGYWNIDNDVSGWTLSEKGERMLLGWGNASYSAGYSVVYMVLAQEVLNDYNNFEQCEKLVKLADVYTGDPVKQEEIYRKALEIQPINIDAWYGLITAYNGNSNKTEDEYFDLAEQIAENLKYFPLPMQHLTNLIKPKLTSLANQYRFTLLHTRILTEASTVPNNTADKYYVYQPSVTRTEANYLLGNLDKTIATFSFDGNDAGKIVLANRFNGVGVRWDYSLDGKTTWKEIAFTAEEEHKLQLTQEELASITSANDIYVHIVGVDYSENNLYKIDILESAGLPSLLYANDLENKLMGTNTSIKWKYREEDEWTYYRDSEPDLTGDKTLIVKMGATGVYLEGTSTVTYNFTENSQPETRKYIPIKHLSIQSVSSEATANAGNAIYSIDGNPNTRWHSAWNGSDTTKTIVIKLDETKNLTALEYTPAPGGNGKIESAQILVSMDGENWTEVVSGTNWTYANTNDVSMKSVDFDPIKANYVKIVGKRTQSASSASFITAAMFNFYENTTVEIVANFSFDGENAGKIVLDNNYNTLNWEYSIDSGNSWKSGVGESYKLSDEEIKQINEENKIKIRFEGDNNQYIINIKKGITPTINPYLNDLENRLIGLGNTASLEWKLLDSNEWISYSEKEPVVLGTKTLLVRVKPTGIYTASDSIEFQFTEDNQPETRKYIPIKHLSIQSVSSEATANAGNAIYSIDGNPNTRWHSAWNGSDTTKTIVIKLDETKNLTALEYTPAPGGNGKIESAQIFVSMDGENWTEVVSGTNWTYANTNDVSMKSVDFDPVESNYIKIVGKRTQSASSASFITAAMFNFYEDVSQKEESPLEFSSDKYLLENDLISRVAPETTLRTFMSNITTNRDVIVVDKDGNELKDDDIISTGMTVKIGKNELEFTVIVIGDIDQDGKATVSDLAQLKLHLIEKRIITGINLMAADVSGDGNVSITDFAQLKLILIGMLELN